MYGLEISSQLPKFLLFLDSHSVYVARSATLDTESSATLISVFVSPINLKQFLSGLLVKPLAPTST